VSAESVRDHYRQQGAEAERERIIALLEDKGDCSCLQCRSVNKDELIALIKGDNK
jgi:hypothetical protein